MDGNKYTGELLNFAPHGIGKFLFSDDRVYEGEIRKGVLEGEGVLSFGEDYPGELVKYEGSFRENQFEGRGKLSYENGKVEVGEFKAVKRNGEF